MTEQTTYRSLSFSIALQRLFVQIGVLPFLLVIALIVFTVLSPRFLTGENLITVARQATYLAIVAMGQMLALLTGGFDLSVGKIVAITSVATALTMAPLAAAYPDATAITLTLGIMAGIAAGTLVGGACDQDNRFRIAAPQTSAGNAPRRAVLDDRIRQILHRRNVDIGLMRRLAERPVSPIDKRTPHARRLRADAIESMVCDEENLARLEAENFDRLCVGRAVWLEGFRLRDGDHLIEGDLVILFGGLEHVGIAVGENDQLVFGLQLFQGRRYFRKRLELLDLADEIPDLFRRVLDAGSIHYVSDGAVTDLAIRRVLAMEQRINHRVLKVSAAPPGDERVRIS
jgi:hypothetical protein